MIRFPLALVVVACLVPAGARAQGGPPLMTDDPDTPGPGRWEINIAGLLDKDRTERRLDMPRLDLNYGVGERIQLKLEVPWVRFWDAAQKVQTGGGDVTTGVKWRFLGQEGTTVAWSTYPQLEFNTAHSSVTKGIVEEGRQFLLPTEITLELAHFEINGEVGRDFVEQGPSRWLYGVSTEAGVSKLLELLAEVHGEQAAHEPAEPFVNVGARQKLTGKAILMIAAGRTVHNGSRDGPRTYLYVGLQLNLPGQYSFKPAGARQSVTDSMRGIFGPIDTVRH